MKTNTTLVNNNTTLSKGVVSLKGQVVSSIHLPSKQKQDRQVKAIEKSSKKRKFKYTRKGIRSEQSTSTSEKRQLTYKCKLWGQPMVGRRGICHFSAASPAGLVLHAGSHITSRDVKCKVRGCKSTGFSNECKQTINDN